MVDLGCSYFFKHKMTPKPKPSDWLFNGATFSASTIMILGIYDEAVLKLIGDTTGYLIIAGFAGLGYSLLGLKPSWMAAGFSVPPSANTPSNPPTDG